MNKRRFIKMASMHFLPHLDWHLDKAIAFGERLWLRLEERGYGEAKASEPKPVGDWYGKLDDTQRPLFNRFWQAFGLKKGREGAAMRWLQIDPDPELAERIIAAAAKEAQTQREPGQVRKFAQGWLAERRWEDYTPTVTSVPQQNQARELISELVHLRKLNQAAPSEALQQQIAQLEARLKKLRGEA